MAIFLWLIFTGGWHALLVPLLDATAVGEGGGRTQEILAWSGVVVWPSDHTLLIMIKIKAKELSILGE